MMKEKQIDEALKVLRELIGDTNIPDLTKQKDRLDAIYKILDSLGATDSMDALRAIEAARRIFDMVSEIEYTAMAVKSLRKEGKGFDSDHLAKVRELMQAFPPAAKNALEQAGLDCRINGKELVIPSSTIGIRAAFDYYQRVVAIVVKIDDDMRDPTIEEVLVQIESFARTHLKSFGWEIRGEALPHNMKQYILDMQNLN